MKKLFMTMIILCTTTFLLVACGTEGEKESQEDEKQTDEQHNVDDSTSIDESEDSTNDSESETQNSTTEENDQEDTTPAEPDNKDNDKSESEKEEYLAKLNQTKEETDEMRENPRDGTTYAMKEVEGNLYDIWDGLLNDIYGELEKQLSSDEMDDLRQQQRDWIKYRDETAKEESLKYEGGTAEQLEYVMVENNLTIERCFELVEEYMS